MLQDLSALETSTQNAVCLTLWHGINWIRSVLNFFAFETKEYYAVKVAERLENLSLLESVLLDEAVPSCPAFRPPGASTILSEAASATSTKLAGDGKKKAGRPPGKKKATGGDERKLAIRQSFVVLKPEVLSILKSARLQPRARVSMNPLSQDASGSLEMPLVRILFSLLEHHVQRSCSEDKKRRSTVGGFWAKGSSSATLSAPSRSEDILEHCSSALGIRDLLAKLQASAVLDAAGRLAAHIVGVADRAQAQLASDADDAFDRESLEAQLVEYKAVLVDYLKVVGAVLSYDLDGAEASSAEPNLHKLQQLQELVLPAEDRIEYREEDPDLLQQVRSSSWCDVVPAALSLSLFLTLSLSHSLLLLSHDADHQAILQGDHPLPPHRRRQPGLCSGAASVPHVRALARLRL